jgi:leucyl/phenylalanyl-tRNA---protein transferase
MPVFRLNRRLVFPPVEMSEGNGLLAVGGDLSPERLILAYEQGIFPWYAEGEPLLWWSPDPRFVLFPDQLKVTRSMRQTLTKNLFRVTYDRNFRDVMEGCRKPRAEKGGTWITDEMLEAYGRLHEMGLAHSVEVWMGDEIVGGLYGVSLGKCFFGESMFTRVSNASKAALIALTRTLQRLEFVLIDCQVYTDHLLSLGAQMIPRPLFLDTLNKALHGQTFQGNWNQMEVFHENHKSGSN